jgi:hypothetical protein
MVVETEPVENSEILLRTHKLVEVGHLQIVEVYQVAISISILTLKNLARDAELKCQINGFFSEGL